MPVDPRLFSPSVDPVARFSQDLADLSRRVAMLERSGVVQEVPGIPSQPARNGTLAVETGSPRLWVRRNGVWQYTTLT